LLDFTGRQPRDRMPLDITSLVADTVDLARSMTTRDVPVTVHASGSTAAVVGDRSQLQQVVMNLLVNAIDAVDPHTGRIDVSTRVRRLADDASTLGLPGGDYVVISVSDNGRGIDPEHQRRIFDPFFTTRSGGRGLGLAVVGGIVRSHSGAVDVRSTPGAGTVFDVLLPASALPLEVPSTPMSFRLRRQPTVLVVDDDDEVRDVTGDILRRAGFQVLSESRGRDAISTFASRHATIDAVVLDLMMPDVTGDEVMVVLRAVEPGIPIVVISGYLDHEPLSEAATMKSTDHLRKPFLPEDLVEAVRRSLHQTPFVFPDDADGTGAGMLFEPRPPRLDG
jgi:CheY-like chemotaxis protein